MRVLIVDDEEAIRRNFKACLEDYGYDVIVAANGRDGLDSFVRERPGVVLTDLRMPELDGTALIAAIHRVDPGTPVVVISGTGDIREAVGAMREGAWDYVLKPVESGSELDRVIQRVVERSRLFEANRRHQAELEAQVTERAAELRAREQRLAIVADNTLDWEWWTAPDGRYVYCARSCAAVTGHGADEFIDDPGLLERLVHPDDRDRLQRIADGRERVGDEAVEFRVTHADGSTRWIRQVSHAVTDEQGAHLGRRGSNRDITDRKMLEAQVHRMQRQEGLSRLASGIAHDLNNVLAPIMMAGDLLRTVPLNEHHREYVDMIRTSAARGAGMVKQLLLYSRGADGRRTNVDPGRVVRDVARLAGETFPKSVHVRLALPERVWTVEADHTQLHQVVLNLCVNARDAMPDGGSLSLSVENTDIRAGAGAAGIATRGPHVVIAVSDTGTGIPRDLLERIFDPFFTTKPVGQGTGLGLSTVQGIVASHGGHIDVRSEPGSGSTFRVYLPARPDIEHRDEDADVQSLRGLQGANQLVLVVDDESLIREMMRRSLQANGYRVLVADGGRGAIDLYRQTRERVDLVIADVWMPDMDGVALVRQLSRIDPNALVIAMSGMAESRDLAMGTSPIVKDFLQKPWRTDDLLAMLQRTLAAGGRGPRP